MKISPDAAEAIRAINPNALFILPQSDIDRVIWTEGTTPISKSDIETKLAELQTAYDAESYQRDRTKLVQEGGVNTYPSIGDQLDMIYHDQVDGTNTFRDAVQAVKDAHPKP